MANGENKIIWRSEKRKLKDLKFFEGNPRRANEKQKQDLEKSLERFNLADPLIINTDGTVIGGNFRLKILKEKFDSETEIDVRVPNRTLTRQEAEELNLRLNKNQGEWDLDVLANFDEELLKEVGWGEEEIEEIFHLETFEDEFNFEEEIKKIKKPKIKQGDIFQLGNHRLMCGDATNFNNVKRLMGKNKCTLAITDPPYNIGLDYSKKITVNKKLAFEPKISDKKSIEEYEQFLDSLIKNTLRVCEKNAHIFFWCDEKYIWLLQKLFMENQIKLQRVCLWIKNNIMPTPQNAFNKVYEACVYGTIGKPKINRNIKNLTEILNKDLQKSVDVYEYIFENLNIWLESRERVDIYLHPTQKPVTLMEKPIRRCSFQNDIILDLCGGSGSTLIACEQLKRKCYMMEINETYCEVIINRWEKFTGQKAKKL
jgi:DNA modification methylase